MGVRVGKNKHTMVPNNLAHLATRVARQARMAGRINITSTDALAHFEEGLHRGVVTRRNPSTWWTRRHLDGKCRSSLGRIQCCLTARDLFTSDKAVLH